MSGAQHKEYSLAELKEKYNFINALCDYAEELIATVEHPAVTNQPKQLELVEPMINEIADASDILSEEFLLVAESKKNRNSNKFSKKRIELALRKIYSVLNEYQVNAKHTAQDTAVVVVEVTNQVVKKIQQQIDKIVEIFFELANISLQSIMSKHELDALKTRNSTLAFAVSQSGLGQFN